MRDLKELYHANDEKRKLAVEKLLRIFNQDQELLKKENFVVLSSIIKIQSLDEKVWEKMQALEDLGFIGKIEIVKKEGFQAFASWDLDKILNFDGRISEEDKTEVSKMKFEDIIDASKKLLCILRYIINDDGKIKILREEDVCAKKECVQIFVDRLRLQLSFELENLAEQGVIGSLTEDGRYHLSIKKLNLNKINHMAADYMSVNTLLSSLIKDQQALAEFKTIYFDIQNDQRLILNNSKQMDFQLEKFIKFFREHQLDFSTLEKETITIQAMTTEETVEEVENTYYQIYSNTEKFDHVLFKGGITLEQLNNERIHFSKKNDHTFLLSNFFLNRLDKIFLRPDRESAILKLILVLAAQHSLDAVFNVVLTLILTYWKKEKIYNVNVIGIKNYFFNCPVTRDFLLKICDSENGQLYNTLKKLALIKMSVSAEQLFLCIPDDKAGEWYNNAVFGATTVFNPKAREGISRLVMARLGAPFDKIIVTYRSQSKEGLRIVSETFWFDKNYLFLSMEKLGSLSEIASNGEMTNAEMDSANVLVEDLKRKFHQIQLNRSNKRKKIQAIQTDTASQNPFDSLPDETLLNIFRFFKLREKLKLSEVCKRFQALSEDRLSAEAKYKQYKIIHRSPNPLSAKELKKATLKLQQAVEETMQELNSLPHWYGDINREQAEVILNQFPSKRYLLRNAEDVEGAIVLSFESVAKSSETSELVEDSSSSLKPLVKMEGALILPKVKKDILFPEGQGKPSSRNFHHALFRMIEGYDGVIYFVFGCFQSMSGYSSLSEIIKYYEENGFTPARIEEGAQNIDGTENSEENFYVAPECYLS